MTIYLDISAAVHRRAGLGRYAGALAQGLAPLLPQRLGLFYNREQGIEPLAGLEGLPERTIALGYKPWRMLVLAGQLAGAGFNPLLPQAELFHATEHLLMPLRGVPTVLTVHDLIFHHLPEHHKLLNRAYLNFSLPLFCRRASHIIAISEHTRQDLLHTYGLPAEKISVIYEAANTRFRPPAPSEIARVRQQYGLPQRFILYVGTIEPRKNLTTLLEAFQALRPEHAGLGLVIVGKKGWLYEGFFQRLRESGLESEVLFPGFVADEDLPAVYAAAELFAFPSHYEGFGLPVLEAMACGTPVVCSNSSSLPEVAGSAARLVSPTDVGQWIGALGCLLDDPQTRDELRRRGLERAAEFSWERTAHETLAVYERLLATRQRRR